MALISDFTYVSAMSSLSILKNSEKNGIMQRFRASNYTYPLKASVEL